MGGGMLYCLGLSLFGAARQYRAVAQLGSAPALGAGGRQFKSDQPDGNAFGVPWELLCNSGNNASERFAFPGSCFVTPRTVLGNARVPGLSIRSDHSGCASGLVAALWFHRMQKKIDRVNVGILHGS